MTDSAYRIADIHLRFSWKQLEPFSFLPGYEPFRIDAAIPGQDAHFTFRPEADYPLPAIKAGRPPVWNSEQWSLHETEDNRFLMRVRKNPSTDYQTAGILERDFSSGTLFPRLDGENRQRPFPFFFPSDEQILLNLLARHHRGLLHGCSVETGGKALLFCGKSGAGKSTVARFWRESGARILNDDRTLLYVENDLATASASPWHGELPDITPDAFPLAGIFSLTQASEHSLRALSASEGLQILIANAIAPFYLPESLDPATEALAAVAERVPAYELSFRPDRGAIDLIQEALGLTAS